MTTANEPRATPLGASLQSGLDVVSEKQVVVFRKYVRRVLPFDGFVFWVRASLVMKSADIFNENDLNSIPINNGGIPVPSATVMAVQGSLHYTTQAQQKEDASPAVNSIVFTSKTSVEAFNKNDPQTMWVATFRGVQFGFQERYRFYEQSQIYHYRGNALYSTMGTQLIDSATQLNQMEKVVNNSLPIWLSMNQYAIVYPSFAVPQNTQPPYIACHVDPSGTDPYQSVPILDSESNSWQLSKDRVRFSLYGLRNNEAIDFQNYIINSSLDADSAYGILNMPIMRDEKIPQTEFQILAQRKTFSLEVSYYQARMNDVAQKLIISAGISITSGNITVNS